MEEAHKGIFASYCTMKFSKPIEKQIKGAFDKPGERLKPVQVMAFLDDNLMRKRGNRLF